MGDRQHPALQAGILHGGLSQFLLGIPWPLPGPGPTLDNSVGNSRGSVNNPYGYANPGHIAFLWRSFPVSFAVSTLWCILRWDTASLTIFQGTGHANKGRFPVLSGETGLSWTAELADFWLTWG
ncbi:hypothetical protein IQE94_18310 (plasmid) [Synechocystis sp. PCC 7339]|uniref:hypothetical protein n=1 Tax=Synechocystis sp. PCC 7339 TaxID=2782213 RepID=UPI001CC040FA|nr:hypothetical protein [Synechocystis sp. PCC 7339]UAJ74677.1 hypothetical protein IQE94_18310 [Synechocystis sp. PCC 7339]